LQRRARKDEEEVERLEKGMLEEEGRREGARRIREEGDLEARK